MKIICGERTLDLDRLNSIKPDGEHVWSEIQPFTYSPENLPDSDAGTYLLTTDNGAVSLRDLAFKILFDLGVWSGARCCQYLAREIARSVDAEPDRGWSTGLLPDSGAAGELRDSLGLLGVHMPPCGRLVSRNLRALSSPSCDLDASVFGMLSDYIYTDGLSFRELHASLSELLSSMPSAALADFIEGVYGVLSCDPDDVKKHAEHAGMAENASAGALGQDEVGAGRPGGGDAAVAGSDAAPGADPPAGTDAEPVGADPGMDAGEAGSDAAEGVGVPDLHDMTVLERLSRSSAKDMPRGIKPLGIFSSGRKLKGSDLTGTDETFTLDYYSGFYRDAMEKADSQGFADELIRSRAGFGTAPIAILQEAVSKLREAVDANAGRGQGRNLESELMQMAGIIKAAAGKLADLPEPLPEPKVPEAPAVPDAKPEAAETPVPAGGHDIPEPDDMDGYESSGAQQGQPAVPAEPAGAPEVQDVPAAIPDEPPAEQGVPSSGQDGAPAVPDEAPEIQGEVPETPAVPDEAPGGQASEMSFPDYDEYDEYGGDEDKDGERPEEDFEDEGDDGEP